MIRYDQIKETRDIKDQSTDDAIMMTYFYDLLRSLALQVCSLLLEMQTKRPLLKATRDKHWMLNAIQTSKKFGALTFPLSCRAEDGLTLLIAQTPGSEIIEVTGTAADVACHFGHTEASLHRKGVFLICVEGMHVWWSRRRVI